MHLSPHAVAWAAVCSNAVVLLLLIHCLVLLPLFVGHCFVIQHSVVLERERESERERERETVALL